MLAEIMEALIWQELFFGGPNSIRQEPISKIAF